MDEHIDVDGTRTATKADIERLAGIAVEHDFEHQLDPALLGQLDPNGVNLVCLRPDEELGGEVRETEDGAKYTRADITLGQPITCELYLKLKGQKTATERKLTVRLVDIMKLPVADPGGNRAARRKAKPSTVDGQRRLRARWN